MSRPLAPKGGNDRVYTPPGLAESIVKHFNPDGYSILEPCEGKGAFTSAFVAHGIKLIFSQEINRGEDFLTWEAPVDWIITNPPWSQFRAFLKKSMEVADNVVFLCLVNAFFMRARQTDIRANHFGMKEILFVPTPPKPWPQTGFSLGAVHIQRGFAGDVKYTYLDTVTPNI